MKKNKKTYSKIAVIVPARNEASCIKDLLEKLKIFSLGQIIIADNGSTDGTGEIAREGGATVVREEAVGYGAACWKGILALKKEIEVVLFLDADLSDDPDYLPKIVDPVLYGEADMVIGSRVRELREKGSMTPQQLFGNWLATRLITIGWQYKYNDLGPFRAISRSGLDKINMEDRRFGWTIEMQIKALEKNFKILEVPVPYRKRRGKSKISGTIKGTALAGYWILRTVGSLWLRKK